MDASYQVAVNNYIASGGSGFTILKENTTKIDTGIPLRDAVMDFMRSAPPCTNEQPCTIDADCGSPNYVCGCAGRAVYDPEASECRVVDLCADSGGRCVLAACVDDMARFLGEECPSTTKGKVSDEIGPCQCNRLEQAYQMCADIACLDERAGAVEDGRMVMIQP